MKAVLPYAYSIRHLPKGRKKEITNSYVDHIEFDLPEVSGDAVTLAVEWKSFDVWNRPHARRAVQWDGSLYVPADTDNGKAVPTALMPRTNLDRMTDIDFFERVYGLSKSHSKCTAILDVLSGNPARRMTPKPAEINMIDRLEERAFAEREFGRLVSIDGELYKRVSHVAFQLGHAEDAGYLYPVVQPSKTGFIDRYRPYRPLEFWQTLTLPLSTTDDHAQFRHPTIRPEHSEKYADLVIHDEAALWMDPLTDFVGRGMEYVVRDLRRKAGDLSALDTERWIRMGDIVSARDDDPSIGIDQDDVEMFEAMFAAHYPVRRAHQAPLVGVLRGGPQQPLHIATAQTGIGSVLDTLDKLKALPRPDFVQTAPRRLTP